MPLKKKKKIARLKKRKKMNFIYSKTNCNFQKQESVSSKETVEL
jgi:hypothetical protein